MGFRQKIFTCRSKKTREDLVELFDIEPIEHLKILIGQQKKSCTSDVLTDQYYCFKYQHKRNENIQGIFLCGTHAATHFLTLLKREPLPLFNPLIVANQQRESRNSIQERNEQQWHPKAHQLYDAIRLLIVTWDIIPYGALLNVKKELEEYPGNDPTYKIKSINTIIKRGGQPLNQMLDELRSKGNAMRNFKFNLLNEYLEEKGITSYF
jgi:hypothetical protein